MVDVGVVIFGVYECGAHIRGACEDVLSVMIVGFDLGVVDVFVTVVCVLGLEWMVMFVDHEVMMILVDGMVVEMFGFVDLRIF